MRKRYSVAVLFSLMIWTCSAQVFPQVDFGSTPVGSEIQATLFVPRDSAFNWDRAESVMAGILPDPDGPFDLASQSAVLDVTSNSGEFVFSFRPPSAGPWTGFARIKKIYYSSGRAFPFDSVDVRLTGNGLPLNVPPQRIDLPARSFVLFPMNRPIASSLLDMLFGNTLGPYSLTEWRMFSYIPGTSAYAEYSGPSGNSRNPSALFTAFDRARSYFVISRRPSTLTIPGGSISTLVDGTVRLEEGWNLVASPYPFDVDWVTTLRDQGLDGDVTAARVFFNGKIDYTRSDDFLRSGDGYYVFSFLSAPVDIPVRPAFLLKRSGDYGAGGWRAVVTMRIGDQSWSCVVGRGTDVDYCRSHLNLPALPLPYNTSTIGVRESISGREYLEYHDCASGNAVRELILKRVTVPDMCRIEVTIDGILPPYSTLALLDPGQGKITRIGQNGTAQFFFENKTRVLKLLVGSEEFVEEMARSFPGDITALFAGELHPNPVSPGWNGRSSIVVGLPEADAVTMDVFDALGRRRSGTAERYLSEGIHTLETDVSQLETGVYLCRILMASGSSMYRKLLVTR